MNSGDMAIMTGLMNILSEFWLTADELAECEEEAKQMQAAQIKNMVNIDFEKARERGPMSHVDGKIPKKLYKDAGSQVHHHTFGKLKLFHHPGHPQKKTTGVKIVRHVDSMGNYFPQVPTPAWHSLPYLGYLPKKGPKCKDVPVTNTPEIRLAYAEPPSLQEAAITCSMSSEEPQQDQEPTVTAVQTNPPATPSPDLTLTPEMKARGKELFEKTKLGNKISSSSFTFQSQTVIEISDDEEDDALEGEITYPEPICISSDEEDNSSDSDSEEEFWSVEVTQLHTLRKDEGIIDETVEILDDTEEFSCEPVACTDDKVEYFKAVECVVEIATDVLQEVAPSLKTANKLSKSAKKKLSRKLRRANYFVNSISALAIAAPPSPTASTTSSDSDYSSAQMKTFLQELQEILDEPTTSPAASPAPSDAAPASSTADDDEVPSPGDPIIDLMQFADDHLDICTPAYGEKALLSAKGSF